MLRGLLLALLLIEGLFEGVARADEPLAKARQAVAESDYVAARPALAAALEAGGHSPEEIVELYRLTGTVDAALGNTKAATEAFTRLLALSPRAQLPAGTSPKIKRPFDAAVRYFKTRPRLEVKLETTPEPPVITLVLVSDPLSMVAKVRVVYALDGGAETSTEVVASERTEIALPAAPRIAARVSAVDVHGNRLVELGSIDEPIVLLGAPRPAPAPRAPAPPPPPPPAPAPEVVQVRTPLHRRWWPYAAAAVVLGGGAGYFGWSARSDLAELDRLNADSTNHSFAEAQAVEDSARKNLLRMNISLGVTGAFAIAAGVMYITTPRTRAETRVTAVPLPGGGALVLGGKF
jgi:hypothetical protein